MAAFSELQRQWEDYQPSKTLAFWIGVAAVIATLIAGFGIAGWVTAGRAQAMVNDAKDEARRELAVAVCVDEFMAERDAAAQLTKLKSVEFFRRSELIATGGFATMPDRKEADEAVAARCAAALEEAKPPAAAKATPVSAKK